LHLVKSGLNRGRVILGKGIHGDLLDGSVDLRIVNLVSQDRGAGALESPGGIDRGGEDTIPNLRKSGVLVLVEAMESRASGLENKQVLQSRLNCDLVSITVVDDVGSLDILTITDKGVGVEFTIDQHTRPLVLDDLDMSNVDVLVLLEHMLSNLLSEDLNVINVGAALGYDVHSVLAGVYQVDNPSAHAFPSATHIASM
jgi:hypothetical protein